jgi:Ca2+-binding RTX toxin-like protein
VNLLNPTNGGVIIDAEGLGTIINDDAPPPAVGDISIGDVTIAEGNSGTQTATFTVTRTGTSPFSVDFATANGTAISGSDYAGISGTLTFAEGQLTQTISVTINGDTAFEPNETFFVNLTNASNGGNITDNQSIATIINDDVAPAIGDISVSDVLIVEGNAGTQVITFTVSRTGTAPFSVDFATANGTATAGSDYTATAGTLFFADGQLTRTVTVTVFGDVLFEANETFFLNLANATPGGIIIDSQAIGTLVNDDAAPFVGSIIVSDAVILEGDSGTRTMVFTVSRTGTAALSVDFATANGTALAGSDYIAHTGTLTFAEGQTSQTVSITITGDISFEANETFYLNFTNATYGATILDYQGLGVILNSDISPFNIDLVGTGLNEDLSGDAGANRIYGLAGQDRLYGKAGADLLFGGAGNDRLDGGTGVDTMFGGSGDDFYRVDEFGDVVSEESFAPGTDDGGSDTVESTISYTLGTFVEKLNLAGTGNIDGAGNSLANTIKGNDAANVLSGLAGDDDLRGNGGDDTLIGGAGKDTLTGGAGADVFVFAAADQTSTDKVADFTSGTDRLRFNASDYGLSEGSGLINGALDPTYFAIISGSQNQGTVSGHGQFLYNTSSRTLFWDADGAGTGTSGVAIATFSSVNSIPVTLTYNDFSIANTLPVVSIANPGALAVIEGQQAYFVVSLSSAATEDIYIRYSTTGGTATYGADFAGSIDNFAIIRAGTMNTIIGVSLTADTSVESIAETFNVQIVSATLASGTNLVLGVNQTTGFIADEPNHVINIISTTSLGSVDPSGLAYVPGVGLFISDSEVEEGPFYRTNNLFRIQTDGTAPAQFSLLNFTSEPTGLTFDAIHNRLYMTDDDRYKVFWVDPNNPTVKLGEFHVPLAADDPEDIAFNPNSGTLFISNGLSHSIVEVDANGTQVGATVILPDVIIDPEALAYDAQHDVFYVSGGFTHLIWKVDRSGTILDTIDVLAGFTNPVSGTSVHVKDMVFAPTSDPNDDPSLMSLYVVDYGNTHLTPALSDDGRLFEIFINGAPTDPGYWV